MQIMQNMQPLSSTKTSSHWKTNSKKIQECRKKDRKKKVKFDVAKDEDILIEIDPACLVILDDHTITADD